MQSFEELLLPEPLARALKGMGYVTPTEIQARAIPVALTSRDVMGCAQTGTGKTAAFSIPLITNILKSPGKRALVLAPTRELALQIDEVVSALLKHLPEFNRAVLIGGASMGVQQRALSRSPRLIVATPGRLVDHLRRKNISLAPTEIFVLDEADRMLDMGFAPQLNEIVRHLPKARQTMLFSATFAPEIQKLAAKYLCDPVKVTVGAISQPAKKIAQSVLHTTTGTKNDTLVDELNANARSGSVLIFTRTKRRTDKLARYLVQCGYKAERIHGDRSQRQRIDAIEGFRRGRFRILVATDIAARGIDIPHIAHVINYDLPMTPEDYVHRIGRTARAGAEGRAVSLLTAEDKDQWRAIAKLAGNIPQALNSTVRAQVSPKTVSL